MKERERERKERVPIVNFCSFCLLPSGLLIANYRIFHLFAYDINQGSKLIIRVVKTLLLVVKYNSSEYERYDCKAVRTNYTYYLFIMSCNQGGPLSIGKYT